MADASILSLDYPEPDIARLTLNDPAKGANILSSSVLDELAGHLDELEKKKDLAGLIFASAKPGIFIAGADLREFVAWIDSPAEEVQQFCRRGQELFARFTKAPFVTVAAIDGLCLGGGAELAVWCDRRILTDSPKTQYGFPEVKLGLYPGWGGTARLPRIVGLSNAVEMITGGANVNGAEAYKMGLAATVVKPEQLQQAAIELIRQDRKSGEYLENRKAWSGPLNIDEMELAFLGATASAYIQQQTHGHYPAPLAALEVMLEASGSTVEEACVQEAEGFPNLFGSEVNRALLNVFFLQDNNKKDPGIDNKGVKPREITSASIIGAGIMGQGIAAANVKRKVRATLTDLSPEALAKGVAGVLEEVSYNKVTKGPDASRAIDFAPYLNGSTSPAEVAASDVVIEAVIENLDIKKQVYADLEPKLGENTILTSNTSTIPITKLAESLKHPERFCGLHFFNPVRKMPLVEVIRGEKTSDETVATLVAYAKAIGKSPIVVGDGPGFLVNRILLPYMTESVEVLLEGAQIRHVEKCAKAFGMPMGPLTLFDVVGIDTAVHAGRVMYAAYPDRVITNELLVAMFKSNRLGNKTGSGFFLHKGKKGKPQADPEVEAMIAERRKGEKKFSPEELTYRLFFPMLLEATRILDEGLVRDVRDVDLGLIYGIGFPPFRGGLLFWADTLGAKKIVELLEPLSKIGKRYEPTPRLLKMAENDEKFYD